ncbi:cupin domain-containing protein [Saccharopolyspora indica]|uniref:cupin domain-containing protein n=1 Tax=Saccharopolyspora indica TaxID=1229659 RepID=UPI0022EA5E8A|nr:cupin domain-containing protein [Saccharopolyspora indica]MDA3646907.1 cupin domain-containing protein [Saccharopolyspora indica]
MDTLIFRNGHRVTRLAEGRDDDGPFLRLEHRIPRPERQAGSHWHPALAERWTVQQGRVRFRVAGKDIDAGPGETVAAAAGQVHRFRTDSPEVVLLHEIRPPLRHWQMFQLWRSLDAAGRTTRNRVPRNPLAVALLWEYQDGYLAGVPAALQRIVLGGLAALARATGYEARCLAGSTRSRPPH